jgi:hypothetical protein
MRRLLIAAALSAVLAAPAAAQPPRPSERIREYAPAVDRMTDAFLNLELGPLLDAVEPGRRHRDRTLRDLARRDDPYFEQRMRRSIYGTSAAIGQAADAMQAAAPALLQAYARFEADIARAIEAPPPPPGDVDDDWDVDVDEDGPDEPYDN